MSYEYVMSSLASSASFSSILHGGRVIPDAGRSGVVGEGEELAEWNDWLGEQSIALGGDVDNPVEYPPEAAYGLTKLLTEPRGLEGML